MTTQTILYLVLFLPWATVFLMDMRTVKHYMPVVIFTALLMTVVFQLAYTYKWWVIHQYIVPWGYMNDVSFTYGIFAVGTLWIFKLTSHKFWLYFVTNVITDALFAFVVMPTLHWLGIATVVKIRLWQYYLVMVGVSIAIYLYHIWQQGSLKSPAGGDAFRQHQTGYKLREVFRDKSGAR